MLNNDKKFYSCCFTGYRPEKFPFSLTEKGADYIRFENELFEEILKLAAEGCRTFYCGMAMGFDLVSAETVLAVKNAFSEPLKLICVMPFESQSNGFTPYWQEKFIKVLNRADKVVCLSDKYFKGCYQKRNIYMVDNSDYVITWFDGQKGGTENTIRYAMKKGRQVFNIYENPKNLAIQKEFLVY